MKSTSTIGLTDVQAVYDGPGGRHVGTAYGPADTLGSFQSSMDLAENGRHWAGMEGIDLCCCSGAGMRFLVRFRGVAPHARRGRHRNRRRAQVAAVAQAEGLADRITFVLGDVCQSGLPEAAADFIWGEDAWCYVVDKRRLIAEAARLVRPGGTIAFTDWVEGHRHERRRGRAVSALHEIRQSAGLGRLPGVARRCRLRSAGCQRHRAVCPLHGSLSQHGWHATHFRRAAADRQRHGATPGHGRRNEFHPRPCPRRQSGPGAVRPRKRA